MAKCRWFHRNFKVDMQTEASENYVSTVGSKWVLILNIKKKKTKKKKKMFLKERE
jgi:hypothetical protein